MTYVSAELRRLVRERAGERCEYCLLPESAAFARHQVDHIIAEKHGGQTAAENLALSRIVCNNHKGSDLTSVDPLTGEIVPLFHPRQHNWDDHFRLDGGLITPLTATGRVTARLLLFNMVERVKERELLAAAGLLQR